MGNTVLGGGSPLNKFNNVERYLQSASHVLHVQLDGSDESGNGSEKAPFATISGAVTALGIHQHATIILGDGEHALKSIRLLNTSITIEGGGVVMFDAGSFVPFYLQSSIVILKCKAIDVSASEYKAFCKLDAGSTFVMYLSDVELVKCTGGVVQNGYGCNGFMIHTASVSSVNAIAQTLEDLNSNQMSAYMYSTSLTNVS